MRLHHLFAMKQQELSPSRGVTGVAVHQNSIHVENHCPQHKQTRCTMLVVPTSKIDVFIVELSPGTCQQSNQLLSATIVKISLEIYMLASEKRGIIRSLGQQSAVFPSQPNNPCRHRCNG